MRRSPSRLFVALVIVLVRLLLAGAKRTKQAVLLVINTRGEVECIARAGDSAITEGNAPEAFDGDGLAMLLAQKSVEVAVFGIEGGDLTAAKLAYQQPVVPGAAGRRQRDTPGCIHVAAMLEPHDQV